MHFSKKCIRSFLLLSVGTHRKHSGQLQLWCAQPRLRHRPPWPRRSSIGCVSYLTSTIKSKYLYADFALASSARSWLRIAWLRIRTRRCQLIGAKKFIFFLWQQLV